jgi:hypothetical protein
MEGEKLQEEKPPIGIPIADLNWVKGPDFREDSVILWVCW